MTGLRRVTQTPNRKALAPPPVGPEKSGFGVSGLGFDMDLSVESGVWGLTFFFVKYTGVSRLGSGGWGFGFCFVKYTGVLEVGFWV